MDHRTHERGVGMLNTPYVKKDTIKNFFPVPNAVFDLGLHHMEINIYAYLLRIEDRRTYQCLVSYPTIARKLGISVNTVAKYVAALEEHGLIRTERTEIITRDGLKRNGCLRYTILPIKKGYRGYAERNIKPSLGSKQISKVTAADVQTLYRKLQREGGVDGGALSPATVRRIHGVLHQALNAAVDRHLIVKNPTDDVTLPKKVTAAKTILNDKQLERFMEAIKADEHWHDFFYLEITTGLRRGEICGLMWTDFDAEKGTLTVRRTLHNKEGGGYYVGETKTGAGRRIIKLPPSTVQLLSERKRTSISQWIFPNPIHPEDPIMPNSGYTRMKKLLAEAGLPDMRFHDLRHTFATHALTSGVDAKTLSGILGHTKTSFTLDTYTHVTGDMHRKASGIVGEFMSDFVVKG